jgi:hypothetical protein
MRYADERKLNSEPLDQFIKRKGAINASATRFSRRLGQDAAKWSKRRLMAATKRACGRLAHGRSWS